ncbi:MAG TPA: HAMP domain-containing histidine kinase [Candidatus Mediterraneibacter stercoripullorum]|nr:HAMP domain-containing histidine kinase [Candidatus Mediterraneibacter stercoripullorum]
MILITICAVAWAAAATWKMRKLKKDVYDFADAVEGQLDALASGKEPEGALDMEDSLTGRISEKLSRISHIMERRAQESSQEKQQVQELIADISHQTRTPLANQKICLEILRDELQTLQESGETVQSALEFLDRLEHQTDKLDFLLESLVKMSRLETGIIQISKENQDLRPALERALSAAVPAASAKGIRLTAEIGEDGIFLPHDGKWTEEAVYNLLDNGVKYTPEGGQVSLEVRQGELFTEIHVRDTGKGITQERQAQVFTRFYREPEVHDQNGIGIGLYLTRKIAELQKGYVEVRSVPGEGSDFCISLPNAPV